MNGREIERECWRIAAQNASPVGLTIILYDLLASDLRGAIAALRAGNIEQRCQELSHAIMVIAQLEEALDKEKAADTSRQLLSFYSHLRAKTLEAQLKQSAPILERLIELVLEVRRAWQLVEAQQHAQATAVLAAAVAAPAAQAAASGWSA